MITRNHHRARDALSFLLPSKPIVNLITQKRHMKYDHREFNSLLNTLRRSRAKYICFEDGIVLDKAAYFGSAEDKKSNFNINA